MPAIIKNYLLGQLAILVVLSINFGCNPSLSSGEANHKKNSLINNFGKPFLITKDKDGLTIWNTRGYSKKILTLDGQFDFDARVSATSRCLHLLTSTQAVSSFCYKKPGSYKIDNLFLMARKLDGLPDRLWRQKTPHRLLHKNAVQFRQGPNGNFYWIAPYALAIKSSQKAKWSSLKTGRSYHEAISDVAEVQTKKKTYLLLASPYNGLKRAVLVKGGVKKDQIRAGKWQRVGKGLPYEEYVPGLYFYESIKSLVNCNRKIYAALGFGQGLWVSQNNGGNFTKVELDKKNPPDITYLSCAKRVKSSNNSVSGAILLLSGDNFAAFLDTSSNQLVKKFSPGEITGNIFNNIRMDKAPSEFWVYWPKMDGLFYLKNSCLISHNATGKSIREGPNHKKADKVKGLYLPTSKAKGKNLGQRLKKISNSGFNAIVVDFKDDFGRLVYNSQIPLARKIKSIKPIVNVKRLIKLSKKNNISVIARLVVFKDKKLFYYKNNHYAFKKKGSRRPWQYYREYWVDPFSEDVWNYNIEVARELESLGVHEIQFDYIRFPSDGPKQLIVSKFHPGKDCLKSESLFDFLARADEKINIPIGIDLYGFNSWYHAGAVIGQDIIMLSRNVQIISPMYYPSHFGSRWFVTKPKSLRSYRILKTGTARAIELVSRNAIIRPYLQAFNYKSSTFGKVYLLNQAQGVFDANSKSFLYWNIRGDYRKLLSAFKKWNPKTYKPR